MLSLRHSVGICFSIVAVHLRGIRSKYRSHEPPLEPADDETESTAGLEIDPEDLLPQAWVPPPRNRVLLAVGIVLALLLMVFLPPLISVNRYRRQIAGSISASLGRPVHMDSVTLTVLPLPGFTLNNFVVGEDPDFGSEPVIRAESVQVTLRVRSLWRRRIEFSRIALTDPSVNLVHRSDGRWNIESILLQASRIEAAPTAQEGAGDAPRFPYIQATGARVNVKMGLEKMPLALTEADFALWLPQPRQWRLRLEGRPTRTDAPPTDTGTLRMQGTLGKAARMDEVPIDLTGEWRSAPLGGASWVLIGRDGGLRGELSMFASVKGTVGENAVATHLALHDLRRADFVPAHMLDATVDCKAQTASVFHAFLHIECALPTGEPRNGQPVGIHAIADVPDVLHPEQTTYEVNALLPAAQLLDGLSAASNRVSPSFQASGWFNGNLSCCRPAANGFRMDAFKLTLGDDKPYIDGKIGGDLDDGSLTIGPVALNLDAPTFATLSAHVDRNGYQLHLTGSALRKRLLDLARALPQFGDGLEPALPEPDKAGPEVPMRIDLESNRLWTGEQNWTPVTAKPVKGKRASRHVSR